MFRFFSTCLFILAFAPVWVAIIFTDVLSILRTEANLKTEWISIICITVVFAISAAVVYLELHRKSISDSREVTIKEAKEEKVATSDLMLTYILPMIAFDFTQWDQMVLFLMFFVILCFLCTWHNYYLVNVVLELVAHYRIYDCELIDACGNVSEQAVLSKRKLNNYKNQVIFVAVLNGEYGVEVGRKIG